MIEIEPTLIICSIIFIGSFVQTILGFGLGLTTLPLLIMFNLSLPLSVFIIACTSLLQSSSVAIKLRNHIPWKPTILAIVCRIIFIPIGVYCLTHLSNFPVPTVKTIIGFLILIIIVSKAILKVKPVVDTHIFLSIAAFSVSGFMGGAIGIGGPPLSLWSLRQKWNANQIRSFMLTTICISLPVMMIFLYQNFSSQINQQIKVIIISFPFIYLGIFAGLKINKFISTELFRKITIGVLILISIKMILAS